MRFEIIRSIFIRRRRAPSARPLMAGLSVMAFFVAGALAEGAADYALPEPLDLAGAKRVAVRNSPGIFAAAERVKAGQAAVVAARAAYFPRLAVSAGATHFDGQETDLLGGGGQVDDSFYRVEAGLRADWLIFDGFSRRFNLLAARMGEAVAEASYDDARRLLMQAVAFSFHSALLAQENARIARQDADFNRELSVDTRKRFDAGAASRSEVLNFEIRVERAQASLIQAERALRTARTVLAELIGLPDASFPGETTFAMPQTDLAAVTIPAFAELSQRARHARPDVLAAAARVEQLDARRSAIRGRYAPAVTLQAGYSETRDRQLAAGSSTSKGSYVGVQGRWEIFDGGGRKGEIAELTATVAAAEHDRRRLWLQVASEIRRQIDACEVARREATLQARIQGMTFQVREMVRSEYNAGKANLTRLNEAQTDVVRAEGVLALSRIAFWQSLEELATAVGGELPE